MGYDGTVTDMGGNPSTFSIAGYNSHIDIPEIAHFDRHTGGFHITLAGDAETDKTTFPDARTALRAIGPMQRVFIGSNGSVRCQHVQVRDVYQPPTAWWPASPADWLDTANTTSNKVFANCRLGWLHVVNATDNGLTPRGRPVCYIVAPSMLLNRTWWCE